MKKTRKLSALLLALVMVFSLSISAFAATDNTSDTVTVKFTYNYSFNFDDTYTWTPENGSDLFDTNSTVTVDLSTLTGDTLAACKDTYNLPDGWDSEPEEGAPGGYLYNIDNRNLMFDYGDNGDGTVWMSGEGFVVGIAPNASAAPTFSNTYLSNVDASTLADDAVIYVDLGTYFFSSVTW